jgi:hypothetical protein
LQRRHLVLVHQHEAQDVADFHAIASRIRAKASDIGVFVVENDRLMASTRREAAKAPTLVMSPGPLDQFRPLRGTVYAGRPMSKLVELQRLKDGGIPVPDFQALGRGERPSPARFGDVVIIKPAFDMASMGRDVHLSRTKMASGDYPRHWPANHPGRREPMIAQRFIDTGPYPSHYRVITLFSEVLFARRCTSTRPRAPLDGPQDMLWRSVVQPDYGHRDYVIARDEDVLDLARRTYAAMPDIPLQGIDIIREVGTGRLFVLEINPGGNTWLFSSIFAAGAKKDLGMDDLSVPFQSWEVAADALIRKTREEAS